MHSAGTVLYWSESCRSSCKATAREWPCRLRKAWITQHPVVGRQHQRLGACILNQPANQNLLTEDMIDQLYRFFLSYDFDHTVQNIWLESKQGMFSHGLDYKTLAENTHYLDKLSRLAILLASNNKPVFAQVGGGAKGAGAHLLSMLAMPVAYRNNCFLKLDDVSRGLTPLLGGSHRLARLPLHLGLYLALTSD